MIKPLSNRIIVEALPVVEDKSAIFIPNADKGAPKKYKVLAAGPGRRAENGKLEPMEVKVGDIVLLPPYGVIELQYEDIKVGIFPSDEVLGIINE